jgi:hypothetical protein
VGREWRRRDAPQPERGARGLPEIPGGDRIGLDSRHPVESARQAQGEEAGAGEELESVASTTGGVPDRRGQRVVQESVRLEEDAGRDVETIAADAECNGCSGRRAVAGEHCGARRAIAHRELPLFPGGVVVWGLHERAQRLFERRRQAALAEHARAAAVPVGHG